MGESLHLDSTVKILNLRTIEKDDLCLITLKEDVSTSSRYYYVTTQKKHVLCTCTEYKKHILYDKEFTCDHINAVYNAFIKMTKHNIKEKKFSTLFHRITKRYYYMNTTPKVGQRKIKDEECPICFEIMDDKNPITHCAAKCGKRMHKACINTWLTNNDTCVCCRAIWI